MTGEEQDVTAADFVRNFARYRETALTKPVVITNHGRRTHVLLPIEEFETPDDVRFANSELGLVTPLSAIEDFSDWISEGLLVLDREMNVISVNHQFEQMVHMGERNIVGRPIYDLHVGIKGSVADLLVQRTINTGQTSVADFPAFFNPGRWTHMRSFPWHDHILALFRDITEEVTSFRLADVKQTILSAMDCHGSIGYARLSPRGTIDRCDKVLVEKLGLNEERLIGVPFIDLVDIKSRMPFREALENCLRSNVGEHLKSRLLSNTGEVFEVVVGIHGLHGTYGVEGAIVVLTMD